MTDSLTNLVAASCADPTDRVSKARKIADLIREANNYRWVGLYDVGRKTVRIIAYSGAGAPAYPQFPIDKGLTGVAIRDRQTVVSGDVANDPRYLTTFDSTGSEIIIPVLDEITGPVVGTIDVESERVNGFSAEDQGILEECALAAKPLWEMKEAAAKTAEIKLADRRRGRIGLRCPHCRHYLVGIKSPRGDFRQNGRRSNLYCSWPRCRHYGEQVATTEAIVGPWPRDGTKCCVRPLPKIVHD